jgi:DNA-binding HxlR family transcriptional regulator
MLAKELKDMELNKLVKRTVYDDTPVLVEYEPTGYCKTFGKIISEMIQWGENHRQVIKSKNKEQ